MHYFHKYILARNSTYFEQFLCPSSEIYSMYTHQWFVSYRFVDSFQAGAYAPARKLSTADDKYRGADKSLARPGRKQATATEDFEFHISYL